MNTTLSIVPVDRPPVGDKTVQLMVTCLCDAFFDDVAIATVQVLEHLGCEVRFPVDQTCCGQPAFNAGDWPVARRVLRSTLRAFEAGVPIVAPSGSCAAMLLHGLPMAFDGEADRDQMLRLSRQTWELADFIVNGLGVTRWPGRIERKLAFHRSCHCRGTSSADAAATLLSSIEGVELVEPAEPEQCCGFGGAFSVSFPTVSKEVGRVKLEHIAATDPDILVSPDMGCLMHLGGLMDRAQAPFAAQHVAQILRDALGTKPDEGEG